MKHRPKLHIWDLEAIYTPAFEYMWPCSNGMGHLAPKAADLNAFLFFKENEKPNKLAKNHPNTCTHTLTKKPTSEISLFDLILKYY